MVLGMETAKALGEAGDKYEGTLREEDNGVSIELIWNRELKEQMLILEQVIPSDALLRDLFLAYHIRNVAERLDKKVENRAVKCT